MNKVSRLIAAILIITIGCGRHPKEVPQKRMTGINGEAIYMFNKDGSIAGVFKEEYNVHDFAVLLVKDTITLGENFVSTIYVTDPSHEIEILTPIPEVISSQTTKEKFKAFEFKPSREGVYNFSGIIKYDTVKTEFNYKFIVVQ